MALPPSAQAAVNRQLALRSGYRPRIHGAHFSGATSSPGANGVDPFSAFPSLQQRTTPDNLGGQLPLTADQRQQQAIGTSLVDGSQRPSFSSINLPPPPAVGDNALGEDDPLMAGFSSLTGIPPLQRRKPLYPAPAAPLAQAPAQDDPQWQ